MELCTLYGYPGQKQYGLDILVRTDDEKYILYQCKRVEQFTGDDLIKAINVFSDVKSQQKWFAKTAEFVLFSSNELIDTSFVDTLEEQRKLLEAEGIKLSKLGSNEISEEIKNDVDIIYEFFGELWVKAFVKREVYEPYFASLIRLPEKKVYGQVRDYIPRKLTNPERPTKKYGYTYYDSQLLADHISDCHAENRPARVIIRSDAGLGKSKELDYLAFHYSTTSRLFPIIVRLKLYRGDLDKLISAFYEFWLQVPKQRLLLLFDGLDEIPNNLLENFIGQFNFLLQNYAPANIVTTARSSFSLKSIGDGADEMSRLKPQYLKPLDQYDIAKYYQDRGLSVASIKKFDDLCKKTRLMDLLNNPFYLKNLVDLFEHPSLSFPKDRAEAISQIIELKLEEDKIKYPFMLPTADYLLFAKKLAVYLTLTGRNSIVEGQLKELTMLRAGDIRYCSLLSCEENDKALSIYFEHNNFQEYLTASYLDSLDWGRLQRLLFHEPVFLILKPRLVNTANYLFTIMEKTNDKYSRFFHTLKEHNPELLLRFEKDKIELETRLVIFKHLIFQGKKEGLYYLRGSYEVQDLLAFVDHTPEALSFLFSELQDANCTPVHQRCLLDILLNFQTENITGGNRQLLRKELRHIVQSDETPAIHDMAIDVMTKHLFLDLADIRFCVRKCPNADNKMVREATLKMIKTAAAEEYFNYILESASIIFPKESNSSTVLGNDFLEIVLAFINPQRAVTWLKFAIKNIEQLSIILDSIYDLSERQTIQKINEKLADLYLVTGDQTILNEYTAFIAAIHANLSEGNKWGNLALFFIKTNTREIALFSLLRGEDSVLYRSSIGADLVDNNLIDQLIAQVQSGQIEKDALRMTRIFLDHFDRRDCFKYLDEKIAIAYPDFFQPVTKSAFNWVEINRQRTERDFELLKSKKTFVDEAKRIYKEVARLNDFDEDWFMLERSEKTEIKSIVTNNIIFRMIESQKLNGFDTFMQWINEWNWDYYVFTQMTAYGVEQKKELPQYWLDWLQSYVNKVMLRKVDFKKSLKKTPDGRYVGTYGARHLRSLFMQGLIQLPQVVLFDMVSFDASGFVQLTPMPVNREYLFQRILEKVDDVSLFKKRILMNLTKRFPETRVLETHCSICIVLQITESIPLLIDHLQKKSTPNDVKDSLVTTLVALGASPEILASELKQVKFITEDWQWGLFKPVFNAILNGKNIWDKHACLKLAERSANKHQIESRLKWRLIKASLKLGSTRAATNFFKYLSSNKSWSDYADIDAKDFEAIGSFNPKEMIRRCIKILGPSVLKHRQDGPNLSERFVTQLIRQLAVKHYDLMLFSLQCYEAMIEELTKQNPDLVYLRWYEKDLVTDYYIKATTFENEQEVLNMIDMLH